MKMKVLSVRSEWAYLIAYGLKTVENRCWKSQYRGPLLIHASGKPLKGIPDWWHVYSGHYGDQPRALTDYLTRRFRNDQGQTILPAQAIIGIVDMTDCRDNYKMSGRRPTEADLAFNRRHGFWAEPGSRYHWEMSRAVPLTDPILGVPGQLKLWEYELPEAQVPVEPAPLVVGHMTVDITA